MRKNLLILLTALTGLALSMIACVLGEDIETIEKKALKENLNVTPINIANILGVTAPVAGKLPVTEIEETSQYKGTVTWEPNDQIFKYNVSYTANIKLEKKEGYTFYMVKSDYFKVAGATVTNKAESDEIIAKFPSADYRPPVTDGNSTATALYAGRWSGSYYLSNEEQWFGFTATAITQYIHASFSSSYYSNELKIQLYDSYGNKVGNQTNLNGSTAYVSQSVISGQVYYIKVTPYNSYYGGTYQIAVSNAPAPPSTTVIPLTINTWTDGNLPSNGEQWFGFTATANTQYIHVSFGTLTNLYVQVYNSSGSTIGSQTNLNSSIKYISMSVTSGQDYFIKVTTYNYYSGTYQIAFNNVPAPPGVTVTPLTDNNWTNGNLLSNGVQWFEFTATEGTHYIHASFGTLAGMYIQLYDSGGRTVGDQKYLSGSTTYVPQSVTRGQVYYIKVTPYNYYSGTYQIAFNSVPASPGITVIPLTINTWTDGNLPSNGEQWFGFTAAANTQYIHVSFGTLTNLYVQVYNSSGSTIGSQTNLSGNTTYVSPSVTSGREYYIKITTNTNNSGTYRVAFNTTFYPPEVITLADADTWVDGEITSSNGEQWFGFTATAYTQYIHVSFGTLTNLNIQVYNSSGSTIESQTNLSGSTTYVSPSVTSGLEYYIKISPINNSGTYRIAFNATFYPPEVITLTNADTWVDGEITSSNGEQWFRFNATTNTQYIHVNFGTLRNIYIQLYDSGGSTVGDQANLYVSSPYTSRYISRSVTSGREYYIKITPTNNNLSGTYQISFKSSDEAPGIGDGSEANPYLLIANTWIEGNIPTGGNDVWYAFNVTTGTTYNVWWNDSFEGNSFKTLDICVNAAYSNNGSSFFSNVDSAWYTAKSIPANRNGTVLFKVSPKSFGDTGTFAVVYSTGTTRP